MRVIATAVGFDGMAVRNPGDEFDINVDEKVFDKGSKSKPSWFEPVRTVRVGQRLPKGQPDSGNTGGNPPDGDQAGSNPPGAGNFA